MNFGNNLKNFRKNSNMSQEALAEKLGVTRQSVSKWEMGDAYPEMSNIVALCKIFHCEITDLVNDNITDNKKFDSNTQKEIITFKKNQQKMMKRISKAIYVITKICKVVIGIPAVMLILLAFIFPFMAPNFKITDSYIKFYNQKIDFKIEENFIIINSDKHYINSTTNLEEFFHKHNNTYFILCIEYMLICFAILSFLTVCFFNYLSQLYKNFKDDDTPFNLSNEKILRKAIIIYIVEFVLQKVTALIFMLVTNVDLSIDFNVKEFIGILIILSVVYLFKYGRMIQVDSKAKLYD